MRADDDDGRVTVASRNGDEQVAERVDAGLEPDRGLPDEVVSSLLSRAIGVAFDAAADAAELRQPIEQALRQG